MAHRGRPLKTPPPIVSASVALAPDAANVFAPLDTDWWTEDVEDDVSWDNDTWHDPSPRVPQPAPPAEPETESTPPITARPVTDMDVDRLWDWVRADTDRGLAFLGFQPTTARDVYSLFAQAFADPQRAAAFAIDEDGNHIGFVLFNPLDLAAARAVVHLYLAPAVRGRLTDLSAQLLRLCDTTYPTLTLVVITPDAARMRLYRQAGFTVTYLLTRAPQGG